MIGSKGFALVLVLWVLSLLIIMAGSFALSMRREAAIVAGSSNNAKALAIAESGLAIAELMLMNPDQQQRWQTDGSIYQIDYSDYELHPCLSSTENDDGCSAALPENSSAVRIRLLSETGKIDINTADQAVLQGLFSNAPMDISAQTRLVNAIIDWRDADDLVRIDGAEDKEYKEAGLSYRPSNRPFQSIEELQLVLGMSESIYHWLENLITIYSGQPKVDLAQASKEVLQVMPGMDPVTIDQYLAAKKNSAINGVPAPTFILKEGMYGLNQPAVGANGLNQSGSAPPVNNSAATSPGITAPAPSGANSGNLFDPNNAAGIVANNGGGPTVVTVITEALLDDGTRASIHAVIKKSVGTGSSPFQILKWQRNAVDDSLFSDDKDILLLRQYAEPEFNN